MTIDCWSSLVISPLLYNWIHMPIIIRLHHKPSELMSSIKRNTRCFNGQSSLLYKDIGDKTLGFFLIYSGNWMKVPTFIYYCHNSFSRWNIPSIDVEGVNPKSLLPHIPNCDQFLLKVVVEGVDWRFVIFDKVPI